MIAPGSGRVFISHSANDAAIASDICSAIEARGIPCWIAPRNVRAGDDFLESIQGAIESAPAFVLVLSRASSESPFVLSETQVAFDCKRPIFPVRVEKVDPGGSLRMLLSRWHRVDAIGAGRESGIRRLAEAVSRRVGGGGGARDHRRSERGPPGPAGALPARQWSWSAFAGGPFWLFRHGSMGAGVAAVCALLAMGLVGAVLAGGALGAISFLLAGWLAIGAATAAIGSPARTASGAAPGSAAAIAISCAAMLLLVIGLALAEPPAAPDPPMNTVSKGLAEPADGAVRPPDARVDVDGIANDFANAIDEMVEAARAEAEANAIAAQENAMMLEPDPFYSNYATVNGM